jgi:hypothetical protein
VAKEHKHDPEPSGPDPETKHGIVAVQFTENDLVPRKQVENPPRIRYALAGGAVGILVLGVAAAILVTIRRKRKAGS